MRVRIGTGPDPIEIRYDGTPVANLTRSDELGNAAVGRVQLGDDTPGRTYDIAYDNIV